jgi:hypothetical protein
MVDASFPRSQSPSRGGIEEDGTFFDDESLGNRVKNALNQSPRPLLELPDSDTIQSVENNGRQQERQYSPLHHDSSRSAAASNPRIRSHDDTAMAIGRLQQDLQHALDDLRWMKEQKESSDAKALDAQRQSKQLLQRNNRLEELLQSSQHSEQANSSGKIPITGTTEGDTDNSLIRDYRAALEQIKTLQAELHDTQSQSEKEVVHQPTNHQEEQQRGTSSTTKEDFKLPTEIEHDSDEESSQPETLRRLIQLQKGKPNFFPKLDTRDTDSRDDAIVDRLSRIRDAADRAALVKDHHREIARLKAQQESKINELIRRNEEKLKKCVDTTKLLLSAKHRETLEGLQLEFERSMIAMEKRHREEIVRVSPDEECCLFAKVCSIRLARLTRCIVHLR